MARFGLAGEAWRGTSRNGEARLGVARLGRRGLGKASQGLVWHGRHGGASSGLARHVPAWQGMEKQSTRKGEK